MTFPSTLKRTRKATRLRSLATRPVGAERPLVHMDLAMGKADGPHRKKLRTYLGIVSRDKVDVTYENWKQVSTAQKDLIWEDIQFDLTLKWALTADKDGVDDTICEKYDISQEKWTRFYQSRRDPSWKDVQKKAQAIQKQNTAPHVLSRGGYELLEKKVMDEKKKKQLKEDAQSRSTDTVIDPPSPIRRHVKWKMTRTKKTGQMMSEAAKEIANKISLEEQASQGAGAIGRLEHPGRVCAAGAGVMIKQYFGLAPRTSCTSSSMTLEDLEQLTQKIRDQLEESITKKVTRQLMLSFSQMQSQFQSQMQSQGLTLPPEPEVGPLAAHVSTKESCVDPSGNYPDMDDSEKYGLYADILC
ncbi:hypothetical protein GmHk_19G054221 [Glycine max]|nr:hypothetical protein GmHk_19G054221 [Glycine max]